MTIFSVYHVNPRVTWALTRWPAGWRLTPRCPQSIPTLSPALGGAARRRDATSKLPAVFTALSTGFSRPSATIWFRSILYLYDTSISADNFLPSCSHRTCVIRVRTVRWNYQFRQRMMRKQIDFKNTYVLRISKNKTELVP